MPDTKYQFESGLGCAIGREKDALLLAGALIILFYILGTFSALVVMPSNEVDSLKGLMQAIAMPAQRLEWAYIVPISATLIAISNLGAAGAYLAATARLPFVAGIDRSLPLAFGILHARWRTPHIALLTQTIVVALFVFLAQAGTTVQGAYDVLVSMGIITYLIPYLFVFAAMFRFQWQRLNTDSGRGFRKPIRLLVATTGFTASLLAIELSLVPAPEEQNKLLATIKILGVTTLAPAVAALLYHHSQNRKGTQGIVLA